MVDSGRSGSRGQFTTGCDTTTGASGSSNPHSTATTAQTPAPTTARERTLRTTRRFSSRRERGP